MVAGTGSIGTHPTSAECEVAVQGSAECDEGAGPDQHGYRFAAACQTVTHGVRGPLVNGRNRSRPEEALSETRHSHDQVGDGRLAGRVPLPAQHAADVFEEREINPRLRNISMTTSGFAR